LLFVRNLLYPHLKLERYCKGRDQYLVPKRNSCIASMTRFKLSHVTSSPIVTVDVTTDAL